jgi:hypothetical protein
MEFRLRANSEIFPQPITEETGKVLRGMAYIVIDGDCNLLFRPPDINLSKLDRSPREAL